MKRKLTNRKRTKLSHVLLVWVIACASLNATGLPLDHWLPLPAPSNDNLCNAIPLTLGASCNGYAYTTVDATIETNEPNPPFCFAIVKTVWFSFVAPASGIVRITTPNFDSNLWMGRAMYNLTGGAPNCNNLTNLILLSCSSDQYLDDLITCGLAPGETYYIQIVTQTVPNEDDFCIEIEEEELADAGPDQVLCNVTSTTLEGNVPLFSDGIWAVISGTATITDPTSPTSGVTGLVPGTSAVLEWNVGYCPFETYKGAPLGLPDYASSDQVTITVDALPTTADAGGDRLTCDTISNAVANTPIVGIGMWSVVSGTATLSSPGSPNTIVTGLVHGTVTTLQWTITNGTCPASTDQMTIGVLTQPDAGPDQSLCTNVNSTTMAGNPVTVGEGAWYVASGMATIDDYSDPTTSVTLTPGVATTLVWQVWFPPEGCNINDTMMITWSDEPSVADAGPDQELCNLTSTTLEANTPVDGMGSWNVISGTATITDPSSPTSGVTGLIPGTSVVLEWTISSGSCIPSIDDVMITVDELPTFADAGPTQFLCDEFSTTLAGNTPVVGTGLWTFNAGSATLSDPTSPVSGLTDLVPGSYVELHWTISNESCPSSTDFVYIFDETPTMTNAGMDQQLCNATSTNLSADPLFCDDDFICETGYWTVISGTANITDPSSPTSEVTGLIPGTTVILEWTLGVENDYFCAGKDTITISIDALPDMADAGSDLSLCDETSAFLSANTPSNGIGMWSLVSGSANITDPGSPTSEVTDLIPGADATLAWTITNGICPASVDEMMITADDLPTVAAAGPDQELCNQTVTALAANTPVIGDGEWSLISGTAAITNPASPTSGVTGLVPGTSATLAWTITNGNCPASVDEVTITSFELPTTSDAGPDQQLCNLALTTLAANAPSVGTGMWTLISGTATITNPSSPASGVTGLLTDASAVLEWTITNGVCPSSADQITITVDAMPTTANAGPDQLLCNQTVTSLAANTPGIGDGEWSLISGTATITNPASPTSGVTGLIPGTTATLEWTISNGICTASADQVTITSYALPTTSNAGPDQQLCNQASTTLAANSPVVGSGLWSVVSGTATITNPSSSGSGVTGLLADTSVVLQWTITNGTCPPSIDQVTITVHALPSTSNTGPDQQLCNQTTTSLAANTPGIGIGQWSLVSGTANITNPASPTSGITGLVPGTTAVLAWTITNGTCPASTDIVIILTDALPTPANAGPDKELCNQTTTSLSGNNPPVGSGLWTVISGTANITNPSSPVSGVTGLIPGTNVTLQWSITNGVCPASTDQMTITNYELPTTADAGPDQQLCNLTTTTLAANAPLEGVGQWIVVNGTATVTNPDSPTSGVTGLIPGTIATLQWEITNGNCPVSIDQLKIRVYELPSPADAGPDKFLCDQSATIVNAEIPEIGNGLWTIVSGNGIILNPDQPSTAVLNLMTGTITTLQWTVSNGTCPPNIDQMTIAVSDFPTQAEAGPDQSVCQSTTTFLQANEPMVGIGFWLIISGPGDITNPESPTSEITGLQPGVPTVAQWTIWNSFCQPSSDAVTLTINEENVAADAGPDQWICGGTSVLLSANAPGNGSGYWTIVQGVATINDQHDPNAEVTDLVSGKTVILEWTITSGDCPPSSDQVSIFVDVSAGFADAGPDLSFCAQQMIMVEGNMPPNGNGVWTLISGFAELLNPNEPVVQLQNLIAGTSIVLQWTVFNGACPPDSDQVVIFLDATPTAADAGPDLDLCEDSQVELSANSPFVGLGSWSVISGNATINDLSSPTVTLSGLIPGTTTVLEWSIGNGVCPLSTDQLSVHVYALPSASDAGEDQVLCNQTSTTLSANTPLIGQGSWTILDGSATLVDSLSPSTSIDELQPGTTVTLQWTVANGVCLESHDLVTIQVNQETAAAVAGPDQVLCGDTSTIIQANAPEFGQGQWSIVNGNAEITDSLSPVTALTGLQPGTSVTLQWTISNGICASTSDELIIQINQAPSTADAGIDQMFCDQTESILNAVAPSIGTGQWEIISGSGMLNDLSEPTTTVTGLSSASPLVLQWVTKYESCENRDTITISTHDLPTPANAGDDQAICATETVLNGNTPSIGQGTWSVVSGVGTLVDLSSPSSPITGLIPGTVLVLQWTIANGVCPQSSDVVTILVEIETPIAIAGDDQHLCEETITAIQAQPANVGTGTWTILSGSGTIQDSTAESTFVTDLLPGTTIVRWMVSGTACPPAHDDMVITIDEMPDPADAGPDETICSSDLMLSAAEPLIGTGAWTILSGLGSLQNQFDPSTLLMDLTRGTSISLEWRITNGICPSVADTITITASLPSDTPDANDDQILCNSTHAILSGNNPGPGGGIGTWTLISGAGEIENISDSVTSVTGLGFGTNLFVWTISNGACPPLSDTVVIQNNDHAELNSNFLVSEFACTGDSVHMFDISGNTTLPSGFFWDFGDNTTSTERDPIHVFTQQGDYTITLMTTLEGCGSVSTSKIIRVFNCASNNPGNGGTRKVLYANVVPNPSDEDFKVNIKLREESEVTITLFDAAGKRTETRKIKEEKDIEEIFLVEVAGLYFFQIQVGYEVLIFKVVKVNGSD